MSLQTEVMVQNLVKCMQETNEQAKNYKEGRNSWKKYHNLFQEHMDLKIEWICNYCHEMRKTTPKGGCYELCSNCSKKEMTRKNLKEIIEKTTIEVHHWQTCYKELSK